LKRINVRLAAIFALSVFCLVIAGSFFSKEFYLVRAKSYTMIEGDMTPAIRIRDSFFARRVIQELDGPYIPERGEVVVFRLPNKPGVDFVMRVIGLPGDTIQMIDGEVVLNGKLLEREMVELFTSSFAGITYEVPRFREILPSGVSYVTNETSSTARMDNTGVYLVPDGRFFVLGDNRDMTIDSRFLNRIGYVPFENIVAVPKHVYQDFEGKYVWRSLVPN